jgi:hypothetical protein
MRERRISPPTRRVGEDGALGRSVEGRRMTGERRRCCCCCCCCCCWAWSVGSWVVVLFGEAGLDWVSLRMLSAGADGGGSRGMVLSVLVLVTRRKSGPVGFWVVGDCLVGDGGGSEALEVMYGWIDLGIVTDTLREGGRTSGRGP